MKEAFKLCCKKANAVLLDKTGAAILLTHSQSGSFEWLLADVRTNLVKAIIAIESKSLPFGRAVFHKHIILCLGNYRHPINIYSRR